VKIHARALLLMRVTALGTNRLLSAFIYLWLGQTVSWLGDHAYRVGLIWHVEQLAGVLGNTGLAFAMSLPVAVLSIFAGVIVDRSDPWSLLIGTDIARMAVIGLMALLFHSTAPSLWAIYLGAALLTTCSLLFAPALQTLIPELAGGDKERVIELDAWLLGTLGMMNIVGPALVGLVLPYISTFWLLGFDALTFGFSALMLFLARSNAPRLPTSTRMRPMKHESLLSRVKAGLQVVLRHPALRPQFLTFPLMEGVSYAVIFLLPSYLSERSQGDGQSFGLLIAAHAVGRVLGITLVGRTRLKQRRGLVLQWNFVVQALAFLAFVNIPTWWLALIAFTCFGIPSGAAQVAMSSFIQTEVPAEVRGRVFTSLNSLVTALIPVMPLVIGTVARNTSVYLALTIVGGIYLAGGLFITAHRAVRAIR
jgi:MFS transporter, DHA3 family, macrolide efflux protein